MLYFTYLKYISITNITFLTPFGNIQTDSEYNDYNSSIAPLTIFVKNLYYTDPQIKAINAFFFLKLFRSRSFCRQS